MCINNHSVYFSLGSNLGERNNLLNYAINIIHKEIGVVVRISDFIETEPWGFNSKNKFLNAVILVNTNLSPLEILYKIQDIEYRLGRRTDNNTNNCIYQDRTIDIDILLYDDYEMNSSYLKIPHPLMHVRKFVLVPLIDISPNLVHPVTNILFSDYLKKL